MRTGGTLVFLMGVASLPELCAGLLAAGMDPDTPAALVERGTTPAQRRLSGTLSTLAGLAEEGRVESPAVSIFGPVCALAEEFDWVRRPASEGRRVVVTRPKERTGTLARRLRDLGADVFEYPCIRTQPIWPCPAMERAVEEIDAYAWLAFTSPAGGGWGGGPLVHAGASEPGRPGPGKGEAGRHRAGDGPGPPGPRSPGRLPPGGLRRRPPGAGLAALARGRVLLLRAEIASRDLTEALEQGGVPYDDIPCYATVYESAHAEALRPWPARAGWTWSPSPAPPP